MKKIKIFYPLQPPEIVLFIRCFIEKITENFAEKTKKQHFCNAFSKYDGIYLLKEDKRLFFSVRYFWEKNKQRRYKEHPLGST